MAGHNAHAIPLAAGLLNLFTGMLRSPMVAALAMSLCSVSVIGDAPRLRDALRWPVIVDAAAQYPTHRPQTGLLPPC